MEITLGTFALLLIAYLWIDGNFFTHYLDEEQDEDEGDLVFRED